MITTTDNEITNNETHLFGCFKKLIAQECFSTQNQLANALTELGYSNVTQTKVSRLLAKLGAIKATTYNNTRVYKLPHNQRVPKAKQKINSIVLNVQHNEIQIIIKTITGGGIIISKIVEAMAESFGILACIPYDSTILVVPKRISDIEKNTQAIIEHLKVSPLTPTVIA